MLQSHHLCCNLPLSISPTDALHPPPIVHIATYLYQSVPLMHCIATPPSSALVLSIASLSHHLCCNTLLQLHQTNRIFSMLQCYLQHCISFPSFTLQCLSTCYFPLSCLTVNGAHFNISIMHPSLIICVAIPCCNFIKRIGYLAHKCLNMCYFPPFVLQWHSLQYQHYNSFSSVLLQDLFVIPVMPRYMLLPIICLAMALTSSNCCNFFLYPHYNFVLGADSLPPLPLPCNHCWTASVSCPTCLQEPPM